MVNKGTEISEKLESIIVNLLGKEFLINPFFRISKSTPEQLTPYKHINLKYSRELLLLYLIICIPINFIKITMQIFLSLLFSYQYFYFNPKNYPTEVLFVSHAIGANIINKDGDQFFALMPEYSADKNLNTTIIYTNHNKLGYCKNLKLLTLKSDKVNRVLIPKFLKPKELIKYFVTIIGMFIKCTRIGLANYFTNPTDSQILFSAANSFFKRPTYTNYLLLLRIKDFCSLNAIQVIFMTFEGHSYEQYVANEIGGVTPRLKVVLYQHSPITPAHVGIKNFMQKNMNNITIMTTGTYYTDFLQKFSNIPEFILVGSSKAEHLQENREISKSKTLLFAPEGTITATKSFLKLIRIMTKEDPIHHYLLRLHPNLPRNIGVYLLIRSLERKQNFSLSNNSLSTDLNLAKFVFYRSSAVGLQALNSSAIPIFYSDQDNYMLNVIPPNSETFYTVGTPKDALEIVNSHDYKKSIKDKKIIFESLFSDLVYQNLDYILIKN
jgi:hypothetical protein